VESANRRSAVPPGVSLYKYPGAPAQRDFIGTCLRRSNKYTATFPKTAYTTLMTRTTRNQLAMRLTIIYRPEVARSIPFHILTSLVSLPSSICICVTPSMASLPSPAIHGWSFGRFDEILNLVEKASALTHASMRSRE
jgi:hypothetical protein